ncbi:MAG: hypothetical protein GX250_00745 [Clostridiales bacterium]|jgi:predicted MFS family arabinose efflux permease|nr:hypothetical protein [Clostridiales bacterium]
MPKDKKSMKAFLPALGLVFGAALGIGVSVLFDFQIAFGAVFGAAAGLLIGLVYLSLSRGKNKPQDGDGA